jgi:hypothetical protein
VRWGGCVYYVTLCFLWVENLVHFAESCVGHCKTRGMICLHCTRNCVSVEYKKFSRCSDGLGCGVRFPLGQEIFLFTASRSALRLTQPPVQLVPGGGAFSPGWLSGRDVNLTTHLQLVPRSRKRGSIHPLPHTSSWRSA